MPPWASRCLSAGRLLHLRASMVLVRWRVDLLHDAVAAVLGTGARPLQGRPRLCASRAADELSGHTADHEGAVHGPRVRTHQVPRQALRLRRHRARLLIAAAGALPLPPSVCLPLLRRRQVRFSAHLSHTATLFAHVHLRHPLVGAVCSRRKARTRLVGLLADAGRVALRGRQRCERPRERPRSAARQQPHCERVGRELSAGSVPEDCPAGRLPHRTGDHRRTDRAAAPHPALRALAARILLLRPGRGAWLAQTAAAVFEGHQVGGHLLRSALPRRVRGRAALPAIRRAARDVLHAALQLLPLAAQLAALVLWDPGLEGAADRGGV
mmetsp:Transcript_44711/g.117234  ORF Transcript_44711/g.117234 Transcript_44711/m.117234 type:complete len:326 (-) Transcript_44711:560-1537(-)